MRKLYSLFKNKLVRFTLAVLLTGISHSSYAALSGTYTIDSSQAASPTNYLSFASAVSDMRLGTRADGGTPNGAGVSGPVIFNVAAGTFPGQLDITGITGVSAVNTITFDGGAGNAATRIITYSGATSVATAFTVKINNQQYIRLRNLTIVAASPSFGWPVHIFNTSSNTQVKNCILRFANAATLHVNTNFSGIVVNNSTASPTGTGSAAINVEIDSNTIRGGYGNYIIGTNANTGISFSRNIIDSTYYYGLYIQATAQNTITNNTIAMNAAGDINSYGIYFNSNTATGSNIFDVSANKISNTGAYGIYINSSNGVAATRSKVYNNAITGGFRTTTGNCAGILFTGNSSSYNWNVYHNSVNLDNVTTGTQSGAIVILSCCTQGTTLLDIRNNIFAVTGLGTSAYAMYMSNGYNYAVTGTTALNYNLYYKAGNINDAVIYTAGTMLSGITLINNNNYNTNSVFRNPSFTGPHNLLPYIACNDVPAITAVATDINGNARSVSTPDVGAYEVTPVLNDIGVESFSAPVTPFSAGSQNISVVIRNYGSAPVTSANVSYVVNGGVPVTVSYTGSIAPCGTATVTFSGPNQFTFMPNTPYSIKAYTEFPNGSADNNNLNDTSSVPMIFTSLSGAYTIDQSQPLSNTNFPSFTDAVNALNTGGVAGPVTFTVMGTTPYTEQVMLTFVQGASAVNTIKFDGGAGNAASRIITFAALTQNNSHTFRIWNTPWVTVSNLTIRGTGSTYAWPLHIMGNLASNVKIKNCIVDFTGGNGVTGTSDNFTGVVVNGSFTTISSQASNPDIEIDSNMITGGNSGLYISGSNNPNVNVRYNQVNDANMYGIYLYNVTSYRCNNNTVSMRSTGSVSSSGIYINFAANHGSFAKELMNNVVTNSGQYGLYVYYNQGTSAQRAKIINNVVGGTFRSTDPSGIYLTSNCNYLDMWFNSVNLDNVATTVTSGALRMLSSTFVDVRNNNFAVTNPASTSVAWISDAASSFVALDYNNYYKPNGLRLINMNNVIYSSGTFKGVGGFNQNSKSVNPSYLSATNLHSNLACNHGIQIATVTTDAENNVRNNPPDIGAYEITGSVSNDIAVVELLSPTLPMAIGTQPVKVMIRNNGNNVVSGTNISYRVNGTSQQDIAWTGTLNPCDSAIVEFNATSGPGSTDQRYTFIPGITYVVSVFSSQPNSSTDQNTLNDTLTTGALCTSLSGTFTIDSGGVAGPTTFLSFTSAIQAMMCGGISGPVVFDVLKGTYPGQLEFGEIPGLSATNTILFDGGAGNDSTRIITFGATLNAAKHTVLFNNTRYITMRNLTIRGTGTTYAWPVHILGASSFITLTDNIFEITGTGYNGTSTNHITVVANGSTTSPTTTSTFNNILIERNKIGGGFSNAYFSGNGSNLMIQFRNNALYNADNYGIYLSGLIAAKVNANVVRMRTTSTTSFGIYANAFTSNATSFPEISLNRIYDAGQYGIQVNGSNATGMRARMVNNSIGGTFRSGTPSGLQFTSSNNWDIWFNSVLITNAAAGSTTSGAAYFASGTGLDFRNNNMAVTSATAGANMLPFRSVSGVTFTPALNYNNYFKAGTPTNLINVGGTNYTPANFTTGGGANSLSNNSGYTTGADLIPTINTNNGIMISVVERDVNDSIRNNPPDMGAFEIPSNATTDLGIVKVYTPDTALSGGQYNVEVLVKNFGLSAITSFNLMHTVNGLSLQDTLISGINLAHTDTLRVVMSGSKQAFIQGGVLTTFKAFIHAPNAAVDDNLINDTLTIGPKIPKMSGEYTIDPAGSGPANFVSFRSAVNVLGIAGVSGPVRFTVAAGTYNEQVTINAVSGASAVNTITFDGGAGNAATRIIDTAANTTTSYWTVRINNAPYVTLRNLTIRASGATYGVPVQISGSSNYVKIKQCKLAIAGTGATSTSANYIGLLISSSTNISNPSTNSKIDYLEIDSNTITAGYYGIYAYGNTSVPYSTQNRFTGNSIDSSHYYGAYFYYHEGINFSNNNVSLRRFTGTNQSYGVQFTTCNNTGTAYHTVNGNRILYAGRYGLYFSNGGGIVKSMISNNMIGGGYTSVNAYGLYLTSFTGAEILHNSVNIDIATNNAQYSPLFLNAGSNIEVKNNIFVSMGTGLPVYISSIPTPGFVMNYNNYFRNGSSAADLIFTPTATYNKLNYLGGGGYNQNSVNVNPGYVSATNLHLASACALKGIGPVLAGVTTDIDGQPRGTSPNLGADEGTGLANDVSIESIYPFSAGLQDVKVVLRNYGSNAVTSVNVAYEVNGAIPKVTQWTGVLNPCDTVTVVFSGVNQYNFSSGTTYTVTAYSSLPNLQTDSDLSNDTSILGPSCVFLSGNYTIDPAGIGNNNFTSFSSALGALTCGGVSGPVKFSVAPGTYNEQLLFDTIPGASPVNTIEFNGDTAATRIIEFGATAATNAFTVKFEGASYITLKNLTIRGNGANYAGTVQVASYSNFIRVVKCRMEITGNGANSASSNYYNVLISGATSLTNPSVSPVNTSYIEIDSNQIISGYSGIYTYGNNSVYTPNLYFRNNTIDSSYYYGSFLQFVDAVVFDNNTVNMRNTGSNNSVGLYLANSTAQGAGFHRVTGNRIFNAGQTGIYTYFASGSLTTARSKMINNIVGGNFRIATSQAAQMQYCYYWDVWHNTFSLGYATSSDQYSSLYLTNCQQLDVRNNHLIYSSATGSGLPLSVATASQITTLDYNNYYNNAGSVLMSLVAVPYNATNYIGASGYNLGSKNINPGFASAFDFTPGSACINGVAIPSVLTDINNVTRNLPPDVGAIEFTGSVNNDIGVSFLVSPLMPFLAGSYPITARLNNYGANTVTSATIKYSINNGAPVTYNYTGTLNPCDTVSLTISSTNETFVAGNSYSIRIWTEQPNATTDGNAANDTFSVNTCPQVAGGNYTIDPAGSGSFNFASFAQAANVLNCGGINGPVMITVAAGVYNEQFTLQNVPGVSAVNTITIDGVDAATRRIEFTPVSNFSAHTVRVANTPYVTIRNLSIISNGATYGNPLHIMGTSDYARVKNCLISFGTAAQTSTSGGFVALLINNEVNVNSPTLNGSRVNNIEIDSNVIQYGYYGIMCFGATSTPYCVNNQFRNNAIDSAYYYAFQCYYYDGMKIRNNNISLRKSGGTTNSAGLYFPQLFQSGTNINEITGNRILQAGQYGIYISSSNGNTTNRHKIINNMIGGGFSSTSARGISIQFSTYWDVWHNSVNLDFPTTAATSSAMYNASANQDIRNNHFIYSATTGNGLSFYSTVALTASTLNYNNYFNGNITNNDLLYVSGAITRAAMVGGSGYNLNSISVDPGFSSPMNLHVGGCNKGVTIAAVTTDIDGQLRNSPPDIGADEAVLNDVGITAIALPTEPVAPGLQNVVISIRNFGGNVINSVNVTYNINGSGPVTQNVTGLTLAPCATTNITFTGAMQYNFPAGRSLVTAYTSAPNGIADNDRTNDTLRRSLCGSLNGTYTINASGTGSANFVSFNDALSTLRCAGVSGPVVFNVAPGTYTEQVTIPKIQGVSSTNTITFDGSDAATRTVTFAATLNAARHTVKLDSAEYITLKNLTIQTTGVSYGWGVHVFNASRFNNISRCIINIAGTTAPTSTSTVFAGIVISGSNTSATTGASVSDLTIDSNTIYNGYYSVIHYGNTATNDTNIIITRNRMNNAYYYGLYVYSTESMKLNLNRIDMRGGGVNQNAMGIYVGTSTPYMAGVPFEIDGNRVINAAQYGIYLTNASGLLGVPGRLYNNMLGGGFMSSSAMGIYLTNASNWDIYHNSVNLDYPTTGINYACLYAVSSSTGLRLKNNHFAYTGVGGTGMTVYIANTTCVLPGGMNFNNFYKSGIALTDNFIYIQGYYTPLNYTGGAGFNQNSFNREPGFRSAMNLATIDGCFNGDSLGVLTDADNEPRASFGDIGADEVSDANNDLGVLALLEPTIPLTPGLKDLRVVVKNFGTNNVYTGTLSYSVNGGTPVSIIFNDTIQPCDTAIVTFTGTNQFNFVNGNTYNIRLYTSLPNDSADFNPINDTFQTPTVCMAMVGNYTIDPAGSGTTNYTTFQSAIDALVCSGVSGPVVFSVAAGTYTEQLVVPAISGTSNTNTITFDGGAGNAATRILTYSATTNTNRQTVRFSGAMYVTFANMTIRNSGATYAWPVHINVGSRNITLKNNVIEVTGVGATGTNTNYINIVVSGSTTNASTTLRVDSITIDSNTINGSYASVFSYNQQSMFQNMNGNTFNNPYAYGLYLYNSYELKFRNNLVNMSPTGDLNGSALYLFVLGTFNNSVNEITGNKIRNMGQYAIYLYNSSGSFSNPSIIANNMITGFRNTTQHSGIYSEYSYYWNIWFNTVNMDTACSNMMGAIHMTNSIALDVRNNIFAVSDPVSNAIPFYAGTSNQTSALNYNNYYKAGSATTLIYNGSAYTPSNFTTGGGLNSISTDPLFNSDIDLHIGNGCNNGVNIASITTDIDGHPRTIPPDMGADEVISGYNDNIGVTTILSPALPLATGTSDIAVIVSNLGNNLITSATVSYSVNGGTPVSIVYTDSIHPCDTALVVFSGANSYTFSQGTAYTIKAYTSLPNNVNDNNMSDDTTTIGPVCPALFGTYTIDPAGSGPSNFTNFATAVAALQCGGVSDDVVFNIAGSTFNEQITVNPIAGTNDTNTVSFIGHPSGSSTISFAASSSIAAHTFRINGASNVVIRNMTIQSSGINNGVPLHVQGGANKLKVKNCNIRVTGSALTSANTTFIPVLINNTNDVNNPMINTGSFISDIEIDSNTITGGYHNVLFYGRSSTPYSNNINFRANKLDSAYYYGFNIQYASGMRVNNNVIRMRTVSGTTASTGMYLYYCSNNTGSFHQVNANKIVDAGNCGIYLFVSSNNNTNYGQMYNNMIGGGFRSTSATGLNVFISNYWNIYHNSVNLDFATNNNQYSAVSFNSSSNCRLVNNILSYAATTGTGLPLYTSGAQTVINYNNYVNASSTNLLAVGATTYTASNYINGGGYNANGFNQASGFTSARNLLLAAPAPKGDGTLGVTTDIEGQLRNAPPDIGADEYFGVLDIGIAAIDSPTTATFCGMNRNVIVKLRNYGNQTVNSVNINVMINGALAGTYTWNGSLAAGATSAQINAGSYPFTGGTYDLSVYTSMPNGQNDSIPLNDSVHKVINTIATVTPAISLSASQTTICSGQEVKLITQYSGGGATPIIQWRKNGLTLPFTGDTLISTTLANNDSFVVILTSTATCANPVSVVSNHVKMNVGLTVSPEVNITSTQTTICAGQEVSFTATPLNGGTTPVYNWYKNGVAVGGDSARYVDNGLANGDSVTVVLNSSLGCANPTRDTSGFIKMTVNPLLVPQVSITSTLTSFCVGTEVTFAASATNTGTAPVFQWKRNGFNVGINNDSLILSNLADNDSIEVVLTSNVTCATPPVVVSNKIGVDVIPLVSSSVSIAASATTVCANTNVTFTATPVNAGVNAVYDWKVNNVSVSSASSYSSTTLSNGDSIKLVVTTDTLCAVNAQIVSNVVVMNVKPYLTPSVAISSTTTAVCSGNPVTFTATPSNGGTDPVYQWLRNGVAVGIDSNKYSGNFNSTDSVSVIMTSNEMCLTTTADTSSHITITVTPTVVPSVTMQASATTVCSGTNVTFTATPVNGGSSPVYTWRKNGVAFGGTSAIQVATGLNNNDQVSVTITSNAACAVPDTASSAAQTITVTPLVTPSVTIVASADSICSGQDVIFTATPVNGGTSPAYQWKRNGVDVGTNNASFTASGLTSSDSIAVELTSNETCVSSTAVVSNKIGVKVNPVLVPSVSIVADVTGGCLGTPVTFTATPVNGGTSPQYQWKVNGVNAGTNSAVFTSSSLTSADSVYVEITSNATCASPVAAASVKINTVFTTPVTPSVSVTASETTICLGSEVVYVATPVNGGTSPTYIWKKNGVTVGSNDSVYSTTELSIIDDVVCIMLSSEGCVTKGGDTVLAPGVLVNLPPATPVVVRPHPDTLSTTFASGGYKWFKDGVAVPGGTSRNLFITANGSYRVEVDSLGCTSMSAPFVVTNVGVNEVSTIGNISLYPNPTSSFTDLQVTFTTSDETELFVTDVYGKQIAVINIGNVSSYAGQINLGTYADGVYFIHIKHGTDRVVRRVVKAD